MDITTKFIKASIHSKNLRLCKTIHAHFIVSNKLSQNHVVQLNHLINLYSKCGDVSTARHLFDKMRQRNIVSWGCIMAAYSHCGDSSEVIRLFRNMVRVDKQCPNEYILATVVSSCSSPGMLQAGRECHGFAVTSGLIFHQYVKNVIINLYSVNLDLCAAMRVLDSGARSDEYSYNSVLNGLLDQGDDVNAFEILCRMVKECRCDDWSGVTCVKVLNVCALRKDLVLGRQIHCRVLKMGVDCDKCLVSAGIDTYGKCGEVLSARKVFDGFYCKNVIIWTSMLNAYLQNECFEETLKLFLEMDFMNVAQNHFTFTVVLNACAGLSALACGNSLHARVEKVGMMNHTIVGNALIHMFSKCGLIDNANTVFRNMSHRDTVSWNLMISGYSFQGFGEEALTVFDQMLAENEQPNYVTFVGVLTACSLLGRVNEGFYYLNHMMREYGIKPGLEHYTCIIGLLCRDGRLNEAEAFMKSNPIRWDVVAWRTLLNACHVHRNFKLGMKVADILLQMNPNDVGTCTLMSNMQAKAMKWDSVVSVRKFMRERNIKKEPGLSWTEIRNETHVFVSGDNEHTEAVKIHEKVKKLLAEIKPLGYMPYEGSELHDVEEEEKEDYLSYHSEKLAIAYALMKTSSEAPIRVIKNLRMCDDCHSAIKFTSKVTNRVIIVRDANRFHRFTNGSCSCGDYW